MKLLMECLTMLSGGQCFLSPVAPPPKKSKGRGGQPKLPSILDCFPSWFKPQTGGTVYQWISAFLEQIITTK